MKPLLLLVATILLLQLPAQAADEPATKSPEPAKADEKLEIAKCPICEKRVNPKCTLEYEKKAYTFNSASCRDKWEKQREESLYHRLGGEPAMDAAITGFYKKVLADERINGFFEDVDMKRQARKQKAFLSAAFGGPEPWKGKDLRTAHKNLDGLDDSHFDAVAENLQATLTELKLDKKLVDEVMAIAGSVRGEVLNRKKTEADNAKGEEKPAAADSSQAEEK